MKANFLYDGMSCGSLTKETLYSSTVMKLNVSM